MRKKGFTLVELLAVIAILAILVIMALPAVLRMYRQSRINNFQNETRSVYRSAQSQFLGDSMLLESGQKILYTNGCSTSSNADVVKTLDMTGNSNFKYYVLIDVDGNVLDVKTTNGTYSYIKTGSDIKIEELNVEDGNGATLDSDISDSICTASGSSGGSGSSTPGIATCVTEGCTKTAKETELTIGGENFYVVSSNSSETVLLAKYDLKQDGSSYSQDTSGTDTNILKVMFVDNNRIAYWDGCKNSCSNGNCVCTSSSNGLLSPYSDNGKVYCMYPYDGSTNCAYVYDENAAYIYPVVNSYANKIGTSTGTSVSGRLMTLEEAYSLNENIRKDMNRAWFWLGSPHDDKYIWYATSNGSFTNYYANSMLAIRPVIIVSTSDL